MMDCEFRSLTSGSKCVRCGYRLQRDYATKPNRNCTGPPGFGDWIARRLAKGIQIPFYGRASITPASYRRWKVRCGLADACNCAERKEKLNRFGRWLKSLLPAQPAE